ncbi:MAG: LLM class flavin-dependent oxidoreductase [Acidimicrobiales bacterium]|nr:LLM class flavin-dependent oxidoreductase [Acidimicrobiales bacterium]
MAGAVQFGMFDQLEHPGGDVPLHQLYKDRLGLVQRAEQAGFWGYHKSEHHMIPLDAAPSINLFLAAAAQLTSTIRLCSLVHLLPFYHPLRLAEEICMLDHLSEGRFEFGFGKGISAPEHRLWGMDDTEADARTEEALELILQALQTEGWFSFEGRFWQFRDVPIEVVPFQKPYPPLWRPGTLDTAARLGVSTMAGGPTAAVAAAVQRYGELRQDGVAGGHPARIGAVRKYFVAATDQEAEERARAAWVAFTEHLSRLFRRFEMTPPNDPTLGGDFDRALAVQAVVAGSPAKVREAVQELAANGGTDYLVGQFAWGDLAIDEVYRSFDLFAEHAMI